MHNRVAIIAAVAAAIVLAAALAAPALLGPRIDRLARQKITEIAQQRFASSASIERVSVALLPPSATASGVVFRHKGRHDVPPLFRIERVEVSGGFGLLRPTPKVSRVRLHGLHIVIPRRETKPPDQPKPGREPDANFSAAEVIADGAVLEVLSKKPGRPPLRFDLEQLRLTGVSLDRPMRFTARLTNPKPPGLIRSSGAFGPWNGPEPSLTPVRGEYTFTNARLSHFKGLLGTLSSNGEFDGELERLDVTGSTDTPDFGLTISGNPVHLKTNFIAVVDGTNGDTELRRVTARFLNSTVQAQGEVAGRPGVKGKTVSLKVDVSSARIEDMLRLAMKGSEPLLSGPIRFQARLELPPGKDRDVVEKLRLDGAFTIDDGKFRDSRLQDKVDSLSRKGQGEPENAAIAGVESDLRGGFALADGVIRFRQLSFAVPGAAVRLDGAYGLVNESLDFEGQLRLDAKVSETTTGLKSLLLKAVDPLLRRNNAGAVIPIQVGGTRSDPSFGLDAGRVLKGNK